MSTLNAKEIRDAIASAVVEKWSVNEIVYGNPLLKKTLPYATIRLDSVPMEALTMCDVAQAYKFEITYIGKYSSAENIEDIKVEKANALIPELMGAKVFASYGMLPLISEVMFEESDDPEEPMYSVTVIFEVQVHASRIVSE